MNTLKSRLIKEALESDLKHIEPSRDIWSEVEGSINLPVSKKATYKKMNSAIAFLAAFFILSAAVFAAAGTAQGKEVLDWVFERFGMHLVANTPQVQEELEQQGIQPEFVQGVSLSEWTGGLPEGIKLPGYLPDGMGNDNAKVYKYSDSFGIRWSSGDDKSAVELFYHSKAFSKGSITLTNGDATDIQGVKIGELAGMAFHDETGWNIDWSKDGHQYQIRTLISLEEALKVAESIK